MEQKMNDTKEEMVIQATNHFTKIISTTEIREHYKPLHWGRNGLGDRFANKKYNYSVIYKKQPSKKYSENDADIIPPQLLAEFLNTHSGPGIIGIYVHSKRMNISQHPICTKITNYYKTRTCVMCGTKCEIVCDHKNDLYNDLRVLDIKTQNLEDFQCLCGHCNKLKGKVCAKERANERLFSAKDIDRYKQYPFEFPWEKKAFDKHDINCKKDTYWYDPVEFERKIFCYSTYVIPILNELKHKVKHNKLKLVS